MRHAMTSSLLWSAALLALIASGGCFEEIEPDSTACATDSDCYANERCVAGACERRDDTGDAGDTADTGAEGDTGGGSDAADTGADAPGECVTFVSGTVTDEGGAASEGALVSGGLAGSIRTDNGGTYVLDLETCETPSHTLTASHRDHCDVTQEVRPNNMTSITADFVLVERYIAGTILTEASEPLPGITLFINGSETRDVSDGDGRFRLEPLPSGDLFTVIVRDESSCWELAGEDNSVTFDAEPCKPSGELLTMACREPNACGGCCVELEPADASPGDPCDPETPCDEGAEGVWRCQGGAVVACVCE